MRAPLVLSLFPGFDLLGKAFHAEGFCVVRGPDVIIGDDIRDFHVASSAFAGVIGGPPCQAFTSLKPLIDAQRARGRVHAPIRENLIPEFERVVFEAQPEWFAMENVRGAPIPVVDGYRVHSQLVRDVWVGGETRRMRRISFGTRDGRPLVLNQLALHRQDARQSVLGSGSNWIPVRQGGSGKPKKGTHRMNAVRRTTKELVRSNCEAQGLAPDTFDKIVHYTRRTLYTVDGMQLLIGNGVPIALGRAVANAVRRAMQLDVVGVSA